MNNKTIAYFLMGVYLALLIALDVLAVMANFWNDPA